MATQPRALKSLYGKKLGLGAYGQLVANGIDITPKCVDAAITVAAPVGDARAITIQLKDSFGNDIDYVEEVEIGVFTTAARVAYATTGGSTGLAIGTDGALLALVAKKRFVATSESDGDIDLSFTDTADEPCFIGVKLPTGRYVMADITLS